MIRRRKVNKVKLSDNLLSSQDVMKKLQICRKTLSKYCAQGKILPIRFSGRKFVYDEKQIVDFINKSKFGE